MSTHTDDKIDLGQGKMCKMGFPGGSVVKNMPIHSGYVGLIPGSRMFPGEENGNPRQYSCLGISMDREDYGLQSMGRKESDTI